MGDRNMTMLEALLFWAASAAIGATVGMLIAMLATLVVV